MATIEQTGEVSPEAIGKAVTSVLASEEFGKSPRMRKFLSYIVEKSLAGKPDEVREYNIALAVFDRDPSFDPATNTIVRVEARRLRRMLAAYYLGAGRLDPVVIEIPRGGYLSLFRRRHDEGADRAAAKPASSVKRRAWYRASGIALAAVILGLVYWRAAFLPGSRVPFRWQLEGSTLRVFDSRDRLCWEKHFAAFDPNFGPMVADKALIADIDNDGRVEVLWSNLPEGGGEIVGSLLCFEQNGRLRWEHRYGSRKTFGTRSFEASYRGRLIRRVSIGGNPRLLTVANHYLWYPSQVALLDPADGRVIEEYWHPGSIYHGVLRDVDGDGKDELVFGAINNPGDGLGHPAVGVLKIPFSEAPRRTFAPGDPFPPVTGGGELAYALFPLPDVCQAMGRLPVFVNFKVDEGRIAVETSLPEVAGIVYYLDFHLKVLEYRFSDNFASLHQRFFVQRLLNHPLSGEEIRSLGKVVAFAAAPDGNSPELKRFWGF